MTLPSPTGLDLCALSSKDADIVCSHREAMFREAGRPEEAIAAMIIPFRAWIACQLRERRYFGWSAQLNGNPVAGIGMMEIDWFPLPRLPDDPKQGMIIYLYVEPQWRRRGVGRLLIHRAIDEAKLRDFAHLVVEPTEEAKPLYKEFGWTLTGEMALALGSASAGR